LLQLRPGTLLPLLVSAFLGGPLARAAVLCATVVDYAHLPLPNASVAATDLHSGKTYSAQSDKRGKACFDSIPEGLYAVETGLTGFLNVRYYPVRISPSSQSNLSFALPFGEITEGGVGQDSTLSGTIKLSGAPVQGAEVCVTGKSAFRKCVVTDDLGEYALIVPAGDYDAEVRIRNGKMYRSKVDVSVPGVYNNRLTLDDSATAK
jgi:hypothetical protein